jgi:hypothetical protein
MINVRNFIVRAIEIHVGLNTQSQDQLILPKSLRTIKTICKAPVNPSPLEPEPLELELLAITYPP